MEPPVQLIDIARSSDYMIADGDLWIIRRFERLHLINIQNIQGRLFKLEQDIDEAAKCEREAAGREVHYTGHSPETLLTGLKDTIKAYDDAVLSLAALKKIAEPAQHIAKELNKFEAYSPYRLSEQVNLKESEEADTSGLLSICTGSRSWLHRYVGRHRRLSKMFREKQKDGGSHQFTKYSEAKVRNAEFALVAACLCLVQLLPVLALTLVSNKNVRLAVIIILIVLVSVLNALFANTVRATNFGAVAAYSAIVVVFISQSN